MEELKFDDRTIMDDDKLQISNCLLPAIHTVMYGRYAKMVAGDERRNLSYDESCGRKKKRWWYRASLAKSPLEVVRKKKIMGQVWIFVYKSQIFPET